jgi:hypothetical protein
MESGMTTHVPALLADEGEPSAVFDLLIAAGWTTHTDPSANCVVVAPGGQARLVFQPESAQYASTDVLWKAEVATFAFGPDETLVGGIPTKPHTWAATFSGEVPVELIAAFLARLVAPGGFDRSQAPVSGSPAG